MRKDDDIEIPSLTLDQDEVRDKRPNATSAPKARPANPTPTKPAHAPSVVYKKANLTGVYILLFLILCASAGAGYWLWQQNMQLRNELYGAKNEIQNLDHQLIAADVSANRQGETLEETLNTHASEIRKLWGVSYDTNRKAISGNTAALEEVQKKLVDLRETVSTQSKRIAIQADAFSDVEVNYNKLLPSVAAIEKTMGENSSQINSLAAKQVSLDDLLAAQAGQNEAQTLSLEQVNQQLSELSTKLVALEKQIAATQNTVDISSVQQTLEKHQEAIDSIDAFRQQILSETNRLTKQINQLIIEQQFGG